MKLLILGCGYTGQRLAQRLLQEQIAVHVTNRQGSVPNLTAFPFHLPPDHPPILPPAAAYTDVTHVLSTIPPDPQGNDPVAQCLLPTLGTLSLQWFGYLSTTGVYGDTQGKWVDETSPLQPQAVRSHNRVRAESAFLQSTLPTHIFRLPGIYGPDRNILERLRSGAARHILKPGHVFSRIHVDDIVQTLWHSMQHPQPGSIYNVADDLPSEPSTLILKGAELLGITPPAAMPYDATQLSPMAQSFWQECRRVSNLKIKSELGVNLLYPSYQEGLQAIWAAESRGS
ncbi:SDR family oxidoreductase [Acaryochloris sp. IP29b_bin.148]|uniref:SDR family oxidoreductase n=1 Tax=Acaryochloris sp. IP29b_bin.148 TaxID=2969218 RepID=UPI0034536C95